MGRSTTKELSQAFEVALSNLVIMWANAESHFVHVLRILLRVDEDRARLVYHSTINTRSRIELVRAAGRMCLPSHESVNELESLCKQFKAVTKARNHLVHAQYMLSRTKHLVGLVSHDFDLQKFDGTNYLRQRDIDAGFLNEIYQQYVRASLLCGQIEGFVKKNRGLVLKRLRRNPLSHPEKNNPKSPHPKGGPKKRLRQP